MFQIDFKKAHSPAGNNNPGAPPARTRLHLDLPEKLFSRGRRLLEVVVAPLLQHLRARHGAPRGATRRQRRVGH
eukprot:3269169-Prymnesium_polylepis.1